MKNTTMFSIMIFIFSCERKNDAIQQFIERNKNKDLSILYNVEINPGRIYNDTIYFYYAHVYADNDTIIVPQKNLYTDYLKESNANSNNINLAKYKKIPINIAEKYTLNYSINLTNIYHDLGILEVNPIIKDGLLIEFILYDNQKVYFTNNLKELTNYYNVSQNSFLIFPNTKTDKRIFQKLILKNYTIKYNHWLYYEGNN